MASAPLRVSHPFCGTQYQDVYLFEWNAIRKSSLLRTDILFYGKGHVGPTVLGPRLCDMSPPTNDNEMITYYSVLENRLGCITEKRVQTWLISSMTETHSCQNDINRVEHVSKFSKYDVFVRSGYFSRWYQDNVFHLWDARGQYYNVNFIVMIIQHSLLNVCVYVCTFPTYAYCQTPKRSIQ